MVLFQLVSFLIWCGTMICLLCLQIPPRKIPNTSNYFISESGLPKLQDSTLPKHWPKVGSQLPAGHPWNDHSTKRSVWTFVVDRLLIFFFWLSNWLQWLQVIMDDIRRRRVAAPVTRRWRSTARFGSAPWGIRMPRRRVGSVSSAPATIPGAPTSAALMRRRVRRVAPLTSVLNDVKDGTCSIPEMDC